ncbi:sigma-54-dependent transcriptional regulator [Neokomagataea thailandica]|uniref:sigma-54-dependent transcriptional regulator n=1 Tax=Neokomagataea TaxID=1223423 RepID=UPI00083414F7|nr:MULTISPECIES: response regulator [Neokomagataea]
MNTLQNESPKTFTVLFVDDDPDILSAARLLLRRHNIAMLEAQNTQEALMRLASHTIDLVLLDLNYTKGARSGAEGIILLKEILLLRPNMPVIVVTGHSGITIAVEAMRTGAADFVMKPWNNNRLIALLQKNLNTPSPTPDTNTEAVFLASSPAMQAILTKADRLAPTWASLLIYGPPASGKLSLAKRLHALSRDENPPCLICSDGSTPLPNHGKTWLCPQIEQLPHTTQRHLAERLEEHDGPRLIALSSLDLLDLKKALLPRLMLHLEMNALYLPPLSQRPEDIEALTLHFLHYFSTRHALPAPTLSPEHLARLQASPWPQGIRSLRATIERAVLSGHWEEPTQPSSLPLTRNATLKDAERTLVEDALRKHSFNVSRAAQELGLTRPALYRRMARYGL